MTQVFSIDAETHSPVDLRALGADAYSRHPDTRCLMLAFHPVGHPDKPVLWLEGDPVPYALIGHIANKGLFAGWNVVGFDRLIYQRILVTRHGFPPIDDDNWRDSMHLASHANRPRSLDGCGNAIGIRFNTELKDSNRIRRITDAKRTEIPTTVSAILNNPAEYSNKLVEDLQWLADRCVQDVEMEEQVLMRLPPWPDIEPWINMPAIDRRINDRGILMDVPLVQGLAQAAAVEMARLDVDIARTTGDAVPDTRKIEALKTWLVANKVELPRTTEKSAEEDQDDQEDPEDEAEAYKAATGKSLWRLRKNDIADILARPDLPEECRLALAMRAEAAKASARKLKTMLAVAGPDGRLRGSLVLGGAQQTMRWCIAENTAVLTLDKHRRVSEKPIQNVTINDKVWDGDSWVSHDGVVFSGVKKIISHDGFIATPEHEVYISDTVKIQLADAATRGIPLFTGNRRPKLYSLLFDVSKRETLFRIDAHAAVTPMVGACGGVSKTQHSTTYIGCDLAVRTGSFRGEYSRRGSYPRAGNGNGNQTYPRVGYYQSMQRLQPHFGRRNKPGPSLGVFLEGDKKGFCLLRYLSTAFERRSEEWRSYAPDTRTFISGSKMETREPRPYDGSSETSFSGLCEMERIAPRKTTPENALSLGFSTTFGTTFDGCCSLMGVTNRSGKGSLCVRGIKGAENVSRIARRRSEKAPTCSVTSCQRENRQEQAQSSAESGANGLLDTRKASSESRSNASKLHHAKTYDILNAGPRNRFMAAGKIVSNSGSKWQPQNFPRDAFANPDEIATTHGLNTKDDAAKVHRLGLQSLATAVEAGRTGDADLLRCLYEAPRKDAQGRVQLAGVLVWISRMLRRTLAAPQGRVLLNGDFAQVEARITAWLAQQMDMLHAYATGQDVYRVTAAGIYGVAPEDVTKAMRQIGKVTNLACGFSGGPRALLTMGYNYGIIMSLDEAKPIVKAWREANAATKAYWYATNDAAANAVLYPGHEFPVAPCGLVSYLMDDEGCLKCRLPSGRFLRYWAPELRQEYWDDGRPKDRLSLFGLTIKGRAVFPRPLHSTVLCENQVQAIAADLLATALVNMEAADIPVSLHVHDSIAAEADEDKVEQMLPAFRQAMLAMPAWTVGLPTGIDVDVGARFG